MHNKQVGLDYPSSKVEIPASLVFLITRTFQRLEIRIKTPQILLVILAADFFQKVLLENPEGVPAEAARFIEGRALSNALTKKLLRERAIVGVDVGAVLDADEFAKRNRQDGVLLLLVS